MTRKTDRSRNLVIFAAFVLGVALIPLNQACDTASADDDDDDDGVHELVLGDLDCAGELEFRGTAGVTSQVVSFGVGDEFSLCDERTVAVQEAAEANGCFTRVRTSFQGGPSPVLTGVAFSCTGRLGEVIAAMADIADAALMAEEGP